MCRYYDEGLYSEARIRWMKACHRIVVQNDVERYRKMLDEINGNQSEDRSGIDKRFLMKSDRASFPPDAKYLPRNSGKSDRLPPVVAVSNTQIELENLEGKKIVKVT